MTALALPHSHPAPVPAAAYLLADHLDATLAAGEDLLRSKASCQVSLATSDLRAAHTASRDQLEAIRALELRLIARVLRARERASDLAEADSRFRAIARLIASSTTPLVDAVEECGDATKLDFETGDGATAYLRSRGLIAADAAGPAEGAGLAIGEDYLVASRISLGALLDLAAASLDTLDTYYELYAGEGADDAVAPGQGTDPGDEAA